MDGLEFTAAIGGLLTPEEWLLGHLQAVVQQDGRFRRQEPGCIYSEERIGSTSTPYAHTGDFFHLDPQATSTGKLLWRS